MFHRHVGFYLHLSRLAIKIGLGEYVACLMHLLVPCHLYLICLMNSSQPSPHLIRSQRW